MKKMKNFLLIAIAIFITSCGDESTTEKGKEKLSGTIRIDGSSTVYPITEAVAEEFRVIENGVNVTIGISGTGGGFKKFGRGETDISDASRPIKDKEKVVCSENKIEYQELTVAFDGLAVLINPENTWVDYLTVAELKMIWEPAAQGVIMKWNQIRAEWPNEEIHLFGPGVASGTYDYFTEAIIGESGASRGDYTASEDDNVLVQGIASDKLAIGFFGLAYYEENKDKMKLIPVDNGNGPVIPTIETVSSGTYNPLSRPIFIYVSNTGIVKPEVQEFTRFYLQNVKSLVKDVGYIPIPDSDYKTQQDKLEDFITKFTVK